MASSTRLTIPFVTTGQNGGETTHNEAMNYFDALLGLNIVEFGLNATPAGVDGNAYIVGASPTGTWNTAGAANKLAFFYSGWHYVVVPDGVMLYDDDTDKVMVKHSGGWRTYGQQTTTIAAIGSLTAVSGTGDDAQVNSNINALQAKVDAVIAAMKVANQMA